VVAQTVDVDRRRRAARAWLPRRDAVRAELGLSGVVFLYVGRLWMGKGLDDLLHAYASLVRAGDLETSLLIVGDGLDEARVRALVVQLQLPRVVFAGFIQQDDLPRYQAASDVFVFPTLGDPNGLVVEEAMAAGLPVISTAAAGDIRVRVPDGEAGFVVPPADPGALAAAMRALASDAEARGRMAAMAGHLVERRGHERYATDFELFAERVMSSARVGRGAS
jgi:glycosyltransferase involved in cell wall biosynthesis